MYWSVRQPIIGGIVFAMAVGISIFTFGEITGLEARTLLLTSVSGIITLCYVIIIGSIYILVIILHLLSVRLQEDGLHRKKHYLLMLSISRISTLLIISAVIVLLLLNIPFTRIRAIPDALYLKIYYTVLGATSILAGGFISVITMIYQTVKHIIALKVKDPFLKKKRKKKIGPDLSSDGYSFFFKKEKD